MTRGSACPGERRSGAGSSPSQQASQPGPIGLRLRVGQRAPTRSKLSELSGAGCSVAAQGGPLGLIVRGWCCWSPWGNDRTGLTHASSEGKSTFGDKLPDGSKT